ncbi:unnamed protein product [Brassica rapa]|uniref:14-3-3 domain-containing protein n=2 Tax=Brassica campestris TaxID=3711 RepID=A0A8D9GRT4_BRACM|nr:unnamed protein product [Brassica rapa]
MARVSVFFASSAIFLPRFPSSSNSLSHFLSPMAAVKLSRNQYVYVANPAEQAERYEEMVQFMEQFVTEENTVEERNLLSITYKDVKGSISAAWRIVSSIEHKEASPLGLV